VADGRTGRHLAEGAKYDGCCGVGVHASDPAVLNPAVIAAGSSGGGRGGWGRNQLRYACMAVAAQYHEASRPGV